MEPSVVVYSTQCQQLHSSLLHSPQDTHHQSMPREEFQQQCQVYQSAINASIRPLIQLQQRIKAVLQQIKQFKELVTAHIKESRHDYDIYFVTRSRQIHLREDLTCQQRAQLVRMFEPSIASKFKEQKEAKARETVTSIYEQIASVLYEKSIDSSHPFSSSESSIRSNLSKEDSERVSFCFSQRNQPQRESKKKRFMKKKDIAISEASSFAESSNNSLHESDYSNDTNVYGKMEKEQNRATDRNNVLEDSIATLTCLQKGTKSKAYIESDDDSDSYDNDNEAKQLEQSVLLTEASVRKVSNETTSSDTRWDIAQLRKQRKKLELSTFRFDLQVKVVKVLYFSAVFNPVCLKMKFLAADATGIGVFWTNYHRKINEGTCLVMFRYKLGKYKDSLQIINKHNFRILAEDSQQPCNYMGVKLNSNIYFKSQRWYYDVPDERCALIKQVADKLQIKPNFRLYRMVVLVKKIIKRLLDNTVCCEIADSSGRMFAYLKLDQSSKPVQQGTAYMLKKIRAFKAQPRHECKHKYILFIDCSHSTCRVQKFRQKFLEVSDRKFKYPKNHH